MPRRLLCPRCGRNAFTWTSWVANGWPCPACGVDLRYSLRQRVLAAILGFLLAILAMLLLQNAGVPWSRGRWLVVWFVSLTATTALSDRVELARPVRAR